VNGFRTRVVPVRDLGDGDIAAWLELVQRAAEPNPFYEPDFALPATRLHDVGDVALLVVESGDEWVACLPFERPRLGRVLPYTSGWLHRYAFLGTPLVDAHRLEAALPRLLAGAVAAGAPGIAVLRSVDRDGPVGGALVPAAQEAGLGAVEAGRGERPQLIGRPDEAGPERLAARHRRELSRKRRRLAEQAGGSLPTVELTGRVDASERFLALEASGWKGHEGTALASRETDVAFFKDIYGRLAPAGKLELLGLGEEGAEVSMSCHLVTQGEIFAFKGAYDERVARYSPGIQMLLDITERVCREGRRMDSCAEKPSETLLMLWPDRRRLVTIILSSSRITGRAAARLVRARRALRDRHEATTPRAGDGSGREEDDRRPASVGSGANG
jgi:CelD/BcsL family acetyltransferase involved in cellulose biosynthesis